MRMLSHIASNMLGSVGGITYMNNPFHQIVARQRTVPVQPNTNPQVKAKSAFSDAVQAWENASDVQRQGWADYAQTVTYSGPLGDYHPSGRMMAIAQYQISQYLVNQLAWMPGNPVSMNPPVVPGLLVVENPHIGLPGGGQTGFTLTTTNNNGEDVVLYAPRSFKQSNARFFFKGPFLTSSLAMVGAATGNNLELEFHNLVGQSTYFCRGRFMSAENPRRISQEFILRAISQTTI